MLKRFTTHGLMALAEASLIALLVVGLIAGTAVAGRSGGGGSLSWRMVTDADANAALTHGDTITFDLSTSASKPYVNVRCYQGTAFVFDGWAGYYSGAWFDKTFTLASNSWTAGAADCVARLVTYGRNGREQTQATLEIAVGG
jgi:hypothetical protein